MNPGGVPPGRVSSLGEAVVHGVKGITGEYLIRVYEKDFTCRYEVTIEKEDSNESETDDALALRVSTALKARIGVKPAKVIVAKEGTLERSTHKAKRVIDERKLTYEI